MHLVLPGTSPGRPPTVPGPGPSWRWSGCWLQSRHPSSAWLPSSWHLALILPKVLVEPLVAGAGWQTIIQYSRAVARLLFQCLSNQTQTRKDYTVLPNTIYWTINKHINIYRTNQNQHELEKLALNLHRLLYDCLLLEPSRLLPLPKKVNNLNSLCNGVLIYYFY